MTPLIKTAVTAIIFGLMAGVFAAFAALNFQSQETLIKDFYMTENAVHVSPHGLRGKMDTGVDDFVLVDLRSAQEYEQGHIAGAVSIPAYSDPDTSAYGDVDRIVSSFAALPEGKDVIVYCYSMPCMTGRKIGKMLAEHGIYAKHLEIGWNEWRYFWNLWNHEHEWNSTNVENYIWKGKDPGMPKTKNSPAACSAGEFEC